MSRRRSKKPKPKPSPTVVIADKKKAAIGQLESAILLWFNEADPISILVLASNAHDCYHALGKKLGKPSWFQEFTEKMPPSFQQRDKYIDSGIIEDVAEGSRKQCLDRFLPLFEAADAVLP